MRALVNRACIDERAQVVDSMSQIGYWEGDTVIDKGRKNAFVNMFGRKRLLTVVKRVESKHTNITADAPVSSILAMKRNVHTITLDNGKEFA